MSIQYFTNENFQEETSFKDFFHINIVINRGGIGCSIVRIGEILEQAGYQRNSQYYYNAKLNKTEVGKYIDLCRGKRSSTKKYSSSVVMVNNGDYLGCLGRIPFSFTDLK